MQEYGYHYASSRNGNLQLSLYEEAEAYLAAFTGAPAALTVSSGLLAGQLAANQLKGKGVFRYAPQTHPALWMDGVVPVDIDWQEWTQSLPAVISRSKDIDFVILTNSLDPLRAQPYDFSWLGKLPADKQITLVVDDSHGLGVTGHEGSGIYPAISRYPAIQLVVVASLGKALGLPGGVILGSHELIQSIRKSPLFSGASPMPPAYLYAFMRGKEVYDSARRQLLANTQYFAKSIEKHNLFQFIRGYPVLYTPGHSLYPFLKASRILISCFPYPTPESPPLTRIVLSSLHTQPDLDRLAEAIQEYRKSGF